MRQGQRFGRSASLRRVLGGCRGSGDGGWLLSWTDGAQRNLGLHAILLGLFYGPATLQLADAYWNKFTLGSSIARRA